MSLMRCNYCERVVDTDEDLESLYVTDGQCVCEHCREEDDDEALEENLYGAKVTP